MAAISDYHQHQADPGGAEHTLITKSCSVVNPNMKTSYATGDAEKSGVLGEWCISIFLQENNSPIGL